MLLLLLKWRREVGNERREREKEGKKRGGGRDERERLMGWRVGARAAISLEPFVMSVLAALRLGAVSGRFHDGQEGINELDIVASFNSINHSLLEDQEFFSRSEGLEHWCRS